MLVEKIKLISYKTIVSEQELNVDPKITVLIGGNETGKTNVLQATNKFSLNNNFASEDISRSSPRYRKGILPQVSIVFSLSADDQQKLEDISPIFQASNLEVQKTGNGLGAYYVGISAERVSKISDRKDTLQKQIETLNKEIVKANLRVEELKKAISSRTETLANLIPTRRANVEAEIEKLTGEVESVKAVSNDKKAELEKCKTEFNDLSQMLKLAKNNFLNLTSEEAKQLFEILPKIYFPQDIEFLPETIKISSLISQPTSKKNKVVANLLKLGGITDLKILQEQTRKRTVVLREASQRISKQLSQIWKQEDIEFQIDATEKLLRISLEEPVSMCAPPEERSESFKWFLSFYVQFTVDTQEQLKNALILLDDPAIHLHPSGQKDFLGILERIAENNQVIYTAHSPFLINKNFPGRIRLLTKEQTGTVINNKPYSNGKTRFWEPLRTAIGVSLGDSLFLGGKNLIVEGVSDQIILTGFNYKLATLDKPYIDLEDIAIVPGMGADSLVQIALLAHAEKLPTMILLDSDPKGDSIVQKLDKKMPQLKKKVPIKRIQEFRPEAKTIEDLIPPQDYLKAVNSAYSRTIGGFKELKLNLGKIESKGVTDNKPKEKNNAMVQFIKEEFEKHKYGDFDKVLVAKELVNIIHAKDMEKSDYNPLVKLFEAVSKNFKG